ncbi:MAG: hypothetical protein LBQ05_01270 [Christensenellaceae bacterium]|nr:hypothetical protein [Christensenellaceae bacterium]
MKECRQELDGTYFVKLRSGTTAYCDYRKGQQIGSPYKETKTGKIRPFFDGKIKTVGKRLSK